MYNRVDLKRKFPNDAFVFFLDTMPNFLAGIGFTYIFYKAGIYFLNRKIRIGAALFTAMWLTLEEYSPVFSHNKYFDYNDIWMSWIGALIGFIIIKYD